jgi:ketosteroid isomerase-like protein
MLSSVVRRVSRLSWAASLAVLATACTGLSAGGSPVAVHADDVESIRSARYAQNEAIAVGDADGIAAFWTDDVEIRSGRGALTVGRAAYRQLFVADPSVIYVRQPTVIEVSSAWPLAFESGEWSGHPGGAGTPAVIGGRYSAQWVKRNGRWLIRAEVFVALSCDAVGCGWPAVP